MSDWLWMIAAIVAGVVVGMACLVALGSDGLPHALVACLASGYVVAERDEVTKRARSRARARR